MHSNFLALLPSLVFLVLALVALHVVIRGAVLSALRQHAREQRELEGRLARRSAGPPRSGA